MKESTVTASEFKAKCLRMLDEIAEHGDTLIITKRGKPIAKVQPLQQQRKPIWGSWKGIVKIKGDLVNFHDDWSENEFENP
jgi:prevent-host-death family protein